VYGLVAGLGSVASCLSPSVFPSVIDDDTRDLLDLARSAYLLRMRLCPGAGESS
jgi:hypothetical protein